MNHNLLKFGAFVLFFGMLTRKHFELSPIWCEYYEPSELNDIDVPCDWIKSNLFERIKISDDRAYYSTSENIDYAKREFLNVYCELLLNGERLHGYLYLTQGKVNSVSIFLGNDIVDLYASEQLSEDNIEALADIKECTGIDTDGIHSIKYILKNNFVDFIDTKGTFSFPA